MKHAIACLNTQIGILLHNASVFHGEGREEDRDLCIFEAYDMRMAVEVLRDEDPFDGFGLHEPWKESASHDADFYRGIVTRIGELYGDAAKRCDDGSMSKDVLALVVPELVETSVNQFRLLAQFVGSKATSHTEIVSDTAAEIRALRVSLEAERQKAIEAQRRGRVEESVKGEQKHRILEVGETIEAGDLFRNTDNEWVPTQSIGEKVPVCGDYLRPVIRVEETPENGHEEPGYRMLEVGEVTEPGDEVLPVDSVWQRLGEEHAGQRINPRSVGHFPVGYYRRPISLDTKPAPAEDPAA